MNRELRFVGQAMFCRSPKEWGKIYSAFEQYVIEGDILYIKSRAKRGDQSVAVCQT